MIRTIALALTAATLVSAPAFAAEISPTQVRLDGRTQAQIRADVVAVATRLCIEKVGAEEADAVDACVNEAVRVTMKKVMARGAYVFSAAAADD